MREDAFIFKGYTWDAALGQATFSYEIQHNEETFTFHEKLIFPLPIPPQDIPQKLLLRVFENLSVILGISYYKLFCPKRIVLEGMTLTKEQAEFWNTVYTKGLGEFFYKNKIDFRGLISFPMANNQEVAAIAFPRQERSLVGIGGGKDSIVAAELLKKHTKQFTAFVMNEHQIKDQSIELLEVEKVLVKREIDPLLLELNKRPDAFNGHVPVSALLAFVALLTAVLYDYKYIVMANEESASYGSTVYLGEEINHQWSKSIEFELLVQAYIKNFVTNDISYFSLLRPFSELAIAQKLTAYPQYFPVFSSCNKNFTITNHTDKRWCGKCPKCAFTFIMLAAFLPKKEVVALFGKNLIADESLLHVYKELLGVADIKPFDCVGTPEEVIVALYLAMQKNEYANDPVMQFFVQEVLPKKQDIETLKAQVLQPSTKHSIPKAFEEVIGV